MSVGRFVRYSVGGCLFPAFPFSSPALPHLEFSGMAAFAEVIALVHAVEAFSICSTVWRGFAGQSNDPLPGLAHFGSGGEN